MSDRFGPDQIERDYAASLRALLADRCPPDAVRGAWRLPGGVPMDLWRELGETGLFGIAVDEAHGGAGLDLGSLVIAMEELGGAAAPGPFAEAAAVCAPLLAASGRTAELDALLAGDLVITTCLGPDRYVAHLGGASRLLLQRGDTVSLLGADSVEATEIRSVDGGRPLSRIDSFDERAADEGRLEIDRGTLDRAFDSGAIAVGGYLVGLSRAAIDRAVEYTQERRQFGRPIGSFQAVQHGLADAHVEVELARGLVRYAAAATADRAAGIAELPAGVLASMAKVSAGRAARFAAEHALQAHGAMGYSFECDLQLWLKRIWSLEPAFGDLGWHRARIARLGALDAVRA